MDSSPHLNCEVKAEARLCSLCISSAQENVWHKVGIHKAFDEEEREVGVKEKKEGERNIY